jgi:hypothetical protein
MIKWKRMITGLFKIIDGLFLIITLGWLRTTIAISWSSYMSSKRKKKNESSRTRY